MKIAIITDLHFGARNDNPAILLHQQKFFKEEFLPFVSDKNNKIEAVMCLGDTFDKRKQSNHLSVHAAKQMLFEPVATLGMPFYVIVGNHDAYFKNTNEVNTPNIFLRDYGNVIVVDHPTEHTFDGKQILMLPWICPDNWTETKELLKATKAKICCAHLQLQGFEMHLGSPVSEGMPASLFEQFDKVLTGHYHHRSTKDNIYYLGTPYEMTWADYNDPRGFHVLDTSTMELEFHQNPGHLFRVVEYTGDGPNVIEDCKDQFLKIKVLSKDDPVAFEQFLSTVEGMSPIECKVLEEYKNVDTDAIDEIKQGEDTLTFLLETMKDFAGSSSPDTLIKAQTKLKELYQQAHDMVED